MKLGLVICDPQQIRLTTNRPLGIDQRSLNRGLFLSALLCISINKLDSSTGGREFWAG